jgi:hypothetical protein
MSVAELIQWQWEGYLRNHRAHANLMIHILAVPLFLVGNVTMIVALLRTSALWATTGFICMVVSMVLQGRGHRMERDSPDPFTGVGNGAARIFLEQWITFPRFVLSGRWARALRTPAD